MKKALNGLLFRITVIILSLCFVTTQGCKKTESSEPNAGGNNQGNAMIWTKNGNLGTVTVICEGQTQTITKYYNSGSPSGCGVSGFANFTLAAGTHSITAYNNAGVTWNGSITVTANDCSLLELTYSGSGGSGGTGGGTGGGNNKAQAIFFTYAAQTPITVTVSGLTSVITAPMAAGSIPSCGAGGCATFDLGIGTHNWTATNSQGESWNGTVTVSLGGCKPVGLNAGGGGGGGSTTGNLIVWTNADQGNGPISVTVNGEYGSVTSYYSSNSVTNPPNCGSAGCANFTLSPGTYSIQASDASGSSWSGSITVSAGNCSSFMLQ